MRNFPLKPQTEIFLQKSIIVAETVLLIHTVVVLLLDLTDRRQSLKTMSQLTRDVEFFSTDYHFNDGIEWDKR